MALNTLMGLSQSFQVVARCVSLYGTLRQKCMSLGLVKVLLDITRLRPSFGCILFLALNRQLLS